MDERERCPTGWVSVSGELPKEGEFVLVYTKRKNFYNAAYVTNADDETKWALQEGGWIRVQDVTHWMPLPSAPSSVAEQPQYDPDDDPEQEKCYECGEYHVGGCYKDRPQPSREQAVEGLVEAAKAVMNGLDHYCDYPDHNEPYEGGDCPHEFIGLDKCESLRKALAHYEASSGGKQ